jgi:hypothetical protein
MRTKGVRGLPLVAASAALLACASTSSAQWSKRGYASSLDTRLLASHNRERAAARLPSLRWDPALAAAAASYGPSLAQLGRLRHSPRGARPGQSENLWMGTRSAFTPEQMVGGWISERRVFRPGIFPDVSTTGNWGDVGHYSQIIWPTTTAVGCAVHHSRRWDYLICRYSPQGNVDGRRVG